MLLERRQTKMIWSSRGCYRFDYSVIFLFENWRFGKEHYRLNMKMLMSPIKLLGQPKRLFFGISDVVSADFCSFCWFFFTIDSQKWGTLAKLQNWSKWCPQKLKSEFSRWTEMVQVNKRENCYLGCDWLSESHKINFAVGNEKAIKRALTCFFVLQKV